MEREEWLKSFLELPNGIPNSDTFRRILERTEPKKLSDCLNGWLETEREARSVVAIDGKTIRGSPLDKIESGRMNSMNQSKAIRRD